MWDFHSLRLFFFKEPRCFLRRVSNWWKCIYWKFPNEDQQTTFSSDRRRNVLTGKKERRKVKIKARSWKLQFVKYLQQSTKNKINKKKSRKKLKILFSEKQQNKEFLWEEKSAQLAKWNFTRFEFFHISFGLHHLTSSWHFLLNIWRCGAAKGENYWIPAHFSLCPFIFDYILVSLSFHILIGCLFQRRTVFFFSIH